MTGKKKKVCVAMSGGVDSSVSAALLKKKGYDVIGAFIVNWSDTKNTKGECAWREERRDAMRVAAKLDIPLHTFNFEKQYRKWVVDYMFREYRAGRTPNPDILCNKFIKFGLFYKEARKLKCNLIATGHYCRIKNNNARYQLQKGIDKEKDQSYFLYAIDPKLLPKIIFPVGNKKKSEVKKIAQELKLPVAKKPESMGICFVGKVNMEDFLKQKIKPKPGDIVDINGNKLGRHKGIFYYTVGQRHGFGIRGGGQYYIAKKDIKNNSLIVAKGRKNPALLKKEVLINDVNWLSKVKLSMKCKAKIRYRQPDETCEILPTDKKDHYFVIFKKPQWAVAPGQSVVFYKGSVCIGGGTIN